MRGSVELCAKAMANCTGSVGVVVNWGYKLEGRLPLFRRLPLYEPRVQTSCTDSAVWDVSARTVKYRARHMVPKNMLADTYILFVKNYTWARLAGTQLMSIKVKRGLSPNDSIPRIDFQFPEVANSGGLSVILLYHVISTHKNCLQTHKLLFWVSRKLVFNCSYPLIQ